VGLQNYWQEVTAYTRGLGRLSCSFRGYEACGQPEKVMEAIGYDPERDVENPADSVFGGHGAGFNVKWNEVFDHMHVHSGLKLGEEEVTEEPAAPRPVQRTEYRGSFEQDKELMAIFERTYGKVERKAFEPQRKPARTALSDDYVLKEKKKTGPEYLLVDGYNIIFAWEELKALAQQDLSIARAVLEDILANYRAFRSCEVILVFDAYKVKGNPGSVEKRNNIHIVYTKEAQTADNYIKRTTYELSKNHQVRVATSDGLEQVIILGHGAMRLSANAFRAEIEATRLQISQLIEQHNLRNRGNYKIRDVADLG
jgi:predicted RNA-binding protein with PIN domain